MFLDSSFLDEDVMVKQLAPQPLDEDIEDDQQEELLRDEF